MTETNYESEDICFDLDISIFNAITQLRRSRKRPGNGNIYNYIKKSDINNQLTVKSLEEGTSALINEGKVINKKFGNSNSFY